MIRKLVIATVAIAAISVAVACKPKEDAAAPEATPPTAEAPPATPPAEATPPATPPAEATPPATPPAAK